MSEDEMKLQARLYAIEHMLTNIEARFFRGAPKEVVTQIQEENRKTAANQTIQGLPPEQSDMIADEIAQHLERLQYRVLQILEAGNT